MLSDTDISGMTPLDEGSDRRREMYLRNKKQHPQEKNFRAPPRFDFAIPAIERPQTYVIDRAVAGMAIFTLREDFISPSSSSDYNYIKASNHKLSCKHKF